MSKIIYENDRKVIRTLELPSHRRTIRHLKNQHFFEGENVYLRQIKIPETVVVVEELKKVNYITQGIVLTRDLSYHINFGSNICLNGQHVSTIKEYIDWYWESYFEICYQHTPVRLDYFFKCQINRLYHYAAIEYNQEKIMQAKEKFAIHTEICPTCNESLI